MSADPVRWGVIGCAGIAEKVCEAIAEARSARVVAVGSRSKETAEAFVAKHAQGAKAYGSYDEVLEDDSVQVVYLPLPTNIRTDWVLKAAAKKKHILCEKPLMSAHACRAMIDACKEAGVQFMDNTMFMHHGRLGSMRSALDDTDVFGTPKHVAASFTIPFGLEADWAANNIRCKRSTEPLGALGDLGWYCVRFILWVYEWEDPEGVSCHFMEETSDGVPLFCTGTLRFTGGRTATFDCSFTHTVRQTAEVVGTKCSLRVDDFVIPGRKAEASFTVNRASIGPKAIEFPSEVVQSDTVRGCVQHTALVERFCELVRGGVPDPFWPAVSLQTQVVLSALVLSARKDSTWIKPKETVPKSKNRSVGNMSRSSFTKQQPSFGRIASLRPDSKGVNLQVKVVSSVVVEEGPAQLRAVVVGDESGVVTLLARGAHASMVTDGASLVVRNGFVRISKGHVQLQVDKWGKLEPSPDTFDFQPNTAKNVSGVEYELVHG